MRQFLIGQKFFQEEFGKYCKEVRIEPKISNYHNIIINNRILQYMF